MKKEQYERPVIIRHQSGLANKFGRSKETRSMSQIEGIDITDLVKEHGSPLFVFSENKIRETYRNIFGSFKKRYPKVQFAWSYKTNYLDAICKIYHDEGSWAEVVSEYEYQMAIRNGIAPEKILYNGPYKPYEFLKRAAIDRSHIHIDHYDELLALEKISEEIDRKIDVTLRLNMDTGIYPSWDRFGFNYDNGEAMDAARRIYSGGKLNIVGIHSHIGTCILEPSAYRTAVEKLVAFSKNIRSELDFKITYIDIGGGLPSGSTLHEQYTPGSESNPPIDSYADAITGPLLSSGYHPDELPTLILETGRALIDEAGYCISTVVANKRLPNGTRSIIIDAGVNTLFTSFWYKHGIYPVKEKQGIPEETIIYGPLCMNIDVIRPSIRIPAMDTGDLMVITPVGAYNVTQWLQFIRMRPAVILIGTTGEVAQIRESEEISVMKNLEQTPHWLEQDKEEETSWKQSEKTA